MNNKWEQIKETVRQQGLRCTAWEQVRAPDGCVRFFPSGDGVRVVATIGDAAATFLVKTVFDETLPYDSQQIVGACQRAIQAQATAREAEKERTISNEETFAADVLETILVTCGYFTR